MTIQFRFVLLICWFVIVGGATLATLNAEAKSKPKSKPGTDPSPSSGAAEKSLSAHCFCKISYDNLTGKQSASGVILDLTGVINQTFTFQGNTQQDACENSCRLQ